MYGHHHTGLGALLLAIGALFTRVTRFLVHHSDLNQLPGPHDIPGWGRLHNLLHKLTQDFPRFRDFADSMREALRHLRRHP